MTRPCNARHPTLAGVRCHRTPGHDGPHAEGDYGDPVLCGATWPRAPRGFTPAARAAAAERASAVLSDLATGLSHAAVAELHGVTRQYVTKVAKKAGIVTSRGGAAPSRVLLARLCELAALDSMEPLAWLEDAARCRKACAAIVARLTTCHDAGLMEIRDHEILRMARGPELAARVRAAVESTEELIDVTLPVAKR